jgi:hypothetical protein
VHVDPLDHVVHVAFVEAMPLQGRQQVFGEALEVPALDAATSVGIRERLPEVRHRAAERHREELALHRPELAHVRLAEERGELGVREDALVEPFDQADTVSAPPTRSYSEG